MKRTKLRRLLPVLLTLLTVIVCTLGITAFAEEEEETRSSQITHVGVVLDNNVDMVFYADIAEDVAENRDTFMTFNDGSPVYYAGTKTVGDVTYAIYRYNNVLPQDLGDVVTAKLYVGSTLTSTATYSLKNYCQYILTNSDSSKLKTLISDLLVYGKEAQALLGEAEDTYVTNGIIGLCPSEAPTDIKVLFGSETEDNLPRGASATIGQSKLTMNNGLQLTFNIEFPEDVNLEEYSACMTINGREQVVDIVSSGYHHRATFTGIYVYEIFDSAKVEIYNGNTRVSSSYTFSLASYIDALNSDATYTGITNAYYNYAYSAHVYAGTHTVEMPGTVNYSGNGDAMFDEDGTITYSCSLCGHEIDTITATHIRDFELGVGPNGSPANSAGGGTLFTLTRESEILADGTSNNYLSIVRDLETNLGSGGFGYYFTYGHARRSVIGNYVDSKTQFTGKQFTFEFDVKSPEAGLATSAIYFRNSQASANNERFCNLIEIDATGAISSGVTPIAEAGTVNSSEWTHITLVIEFYDTDAGSYMFIECYINNELVNSFSIANLLLNHTFTDIHISVDTKDLEDGEGIFFDNFIFAQGAVHSYAESVVEHIDRINNGSLRQLVDMINNDFDIEDFSYVVRWDKTSSYVTKEYQALRDMDTEKYSDPAVTPKNYQHPRLLFNSSDIPAIRENIAKPENAGAAATFMSKVTSSVDGKLTPTENIAPQTFEHTNYDTNILRAIEAKAFYYAIYKDDTSGLYEDAELRGYQAIYAMKNYLLTFDVQWKMSDQCRYYGEVMYYSALVYDWCYDLLTEEDKQQFMLGVQNLCCDGTSNAPWKGNTHEGRKLEGGFPALAIENQTPLTGHGAEAQVLRDYFSFAIAIYDENSTWYDYVGGMIYQNYVEARNYFYTSGYYPDGAAGYNVYRFICDLYNAWLFKGMGVELPYNEEDMATVIHGLVAMEINDNFMFATADGSGTSSYGQYRLNTTVGDAALISSYLFNDSAALAIAERLCAYEYNRYGFSHQLGISCAYYLILTANDLEPAEDYREKINNVEYHGGFQQQVISRDTFEDDSVVVLMQGAQHYPGGHTHQNAGNFQIWYKGMLTRDDGLYDAYGSDHHFYYHMSATAHNTLLIYNQNLATNPVGPSNNTKYYNGGQKYELSIPQSFNSWLSSDKFSYGQLIGMQTDDEDNPSYVYFANDITNAYDVETVDYVERSFMTLYTGDAETPMVMFVFDNITSDSPEFQKTFLLQCAEAPEINGNTVTVDNGEGKLVLTSLLGADTIKAYGRTSENGVVTGNGNGSERFYLSGPGENLLPGGATSIGDRNSDLDIVWGHVEIQPDAVQNTNQLMNVLYVSDSGTTVSATPTLLESGYLTGATFKNYTAMFVNDTMQSSVPHTFFTEGDETMTYYIGGLTEGSWEVSINGVVIGSYEATTDGKMITFEGETGTVTITPGDNIRPAGTSLIFYYTNAGRLPEGTESFYFNETGLVLPIPTKSGSTFAGWFLDKDYTVPITEIPAGSTENYTVYAKWSTPIIDAPYYQGGYLGDYGVLTHTPDGGGSFEIVRGEENYLLWKDTDSNGSSIIGRDGKYSLYADESLQVSYILTVGRNGTDPLMPIQIYLRDTVVKTATGGNTYLNIFKSDSAGNLYLGQNIKFAQIPGSGMYTIRFVMDFATGYMYAYGENGELLKETSMAAAGITLPAQYSNYEQYMRGLSGNGNSLISVKANAPGSIRISQIKVVSGNVSTSCRNFGSTSTMHNWGAGVVIEPASTTDCTPGKMQFACTDCGMVKEEAIISEMPHISLSSSYENSAMTYTCDTCGCYFTLGTGVYLTGSDLSNVIGNGNAANYTTTAGTNQPVLKNGYYELINKSGKSGDLELWIPSMGATMSGFSSDNNSVGFLSFKVNAYTDEGFSFNFVDPSADGVRWSSSWCLKESFFTISAPKTEYGETSVSITGWEGIELKNVDITGNDKFTGWIDVVIRIDLDPDEDAVILSYYIDGEYVGSASHELTTSTNAISSICISGSTATVGSGIKLDDISFGFTPNGVWKAN